MGTRSLTIFHDEDGEEILVMYRQYDGYPSEHGKDLLEFVKSKKIVNGISEYNDTSANGMNCLAAQVVARFKNEFQLGGIYLYPAGTRNMNEEYVYNVLFEKYNVPANVTCCESDGTFQCPIDLEEEILK